MAKALLKASVLFLIFVQSLAWNTKTIEEAASKLHSRFVSKKQETAKPSIALQDGPLTNKNFTTWEATVYDINLDLPAEHRWDAVAAVLNPGKTMGPDWIEGYLLNSTKLTPREVELISLFASSIESLLKAEEAAELNGLSKALGVPVGQLAIINVAYELRRLGGGLPNHTSTTSVGGPAKMSKARRMGACSALVAADATGSVYHSRNMDWNIPDDMLDLIFTCRFLRGGKVAYEGTCILGFIGLFTGVAPGIAAGNINERDLGGSVVEDALEALLFGAPPVAVLLRRALAEATDYGSFVTTLQTATVAAPVYYIVSGPAPGQGAVITRKRVGAVDTYPITSTTWFAYESNYDRWNEPPPFDDRRKYALEYINAKGRTAIASEDGTLGAMDIWPVANECTSQTVFLDPRAGGGVTTYVRKYIGPGGCKQED